MVAEATSKEAHRAARAKRYETRYVAYKAAKK